MNPIAKQQAEPAPNPSLITEEQLKHWLHCKTRGTLERLLRAHGIRIIHGVNGTISTTLEAINNAMQGTNDNDDFK